MARPPCEHGNRDKYCKECAGSIVNIPSPDKRRMDLANQIDQSRLVKKLQAENSRIKADLLKLLPIAHGNASVMIASEQFTTRIEEQLTQELKFIDELTERYGGGE